MRFAILDFPDEEHLVQNSRIHHFADTGIWLHSRGAGDGPLLDTVIVERGAALHEALGEMGVCIDEANGTDFVSSTVDMSGYVPPSAYSSATGIYGYFGSSWCQSTPSTTRTFTIQGNAVLGAGVGNDAGDYDTGIYFYLVCGSGSTQRVAIAENLIDGWNYVGQLFYDSSDITDSCNVVTNCLRAVDINRNNNLSGSELRFRKNRFEATTSRADLFALRTNDAQKTKFGPSSTAGRGLNELAVHVDDTKFIVEEDSSAADQLNAKNGYWFTYTSSTFTQLTSNSNNQITNRFAPQPSEEEQGYNIGYSPLETSTPSSGCDGPGSTAHSSPGVAATEDSASDATESQFDSPITFAIGIAHPNPGRGGVALDLAIPADRLGEYSLKVFDVRGRRVFETYALADQPGDWTLRWGGLDSSGKELGAGIYFLRIEGPQGVEETRKVVQLR